MRKRLVYLLFCSVLLAFRLPAQPNPLPGNFDTYIFASQSNVRAQPDTRAPVVARLDAGTPVTVLLVTETTSTINQMTLPWYYIRLEDNRTGYIWGGLLSFGGVRQLGDVRFVLGLTALGPVVSEEMEGTRHTGLEVRALRAGAVLDRCTVGLELTGGHSLYAREIESGARGLKGFSALLVCTAGYEACGYPWYDWYLLWDGSRLSCLPPCESVADAGVFAHVESYVFPQGATPDEQGHFGAPGDIYFQIEHHEEDETEQGWNKDNWTRARRMVRDGKAFRRPADMGVPD